MTPAFSLTQADLVRVHGRLGERPAVDAAVAECAERVARELGEGARAVRRGPSDYAVVVPELELANPDTTVADAIARVAGRVR
jgi:hypothetical protein